MLIERRSVRAVAKEIASAAEGAMDSYRSQEVTDEPHITDRMLGAISERLRSKDIKGINWKAKTLRTGRGIASEEKTHGADFMGVLNIDIPGLSVKKGFLAQAKRAEPGKPLDNSNWDRLQRQCRTMLDRTPAAFITVYSKEKGVFFVPAVELINSTQQDLFGHYGRKTQTFFELFIECFIGDRKLHSANIATLNSLADYSVSYMIEFIGTASEKYE